MARNALLQNPIEEPKIPPAPVASIEVHKAKRFDMLMNSIVYVKGSGNVLMKDLFCPLCRGAAVVIRRKDGSRMDPCDFSSYVRQMKSSGSSGVAWQPGRRIAPYEP